MKKYDVLQHGILEDDFSNHAFVVIERVTLGFPGPEALSYFTIIGRPMPYVAARSKADDWNKTGP